MAFATLTLSQLFHAFNVRSEDESVFAMGITSNPAMNRAFLIGLALQLAVLLLPPLQGVFCVVPLSWRQWLGVLGLAVAPIPICEVVKAAGKRLLSVIDQSKGLSNKELSRFTDQIESLCDKYSRK